MTNGKLTTNHYPLNHYESKVAKEVFYNQIMRIKPEIVTTNQEKNIKKENYSGGLQKTHIFTSSHETAVDQFRSVEVVSPQINIRLFMTMIVLAVLTFTFYLSYINIRTFLL